MDERFERWFSERGWLPFAFQREVWDALAAGNSGLLHASTGSGKTLAIWFAALAWALRNPPRQASPLRILWITPMRALAQDTARALSESLRELELGWEVGVRTGDTSSAQRARLDKRLPIALVTTPETVSLLMSRDGAQQQLSGVDLVVVDEWHELLGSKRGVQTQLAIARLRRWNANLLVWGLSATLGNLSHALSVLLGGDRAGVIVQGRVPKDMIIDTIIPARPDRFPWGGHMGTTLLAQVIAEIEDSASTLLFTNTRSQAETWYRALLEARPDWAGVIALHHGSIDHKVRNWVEAGLKDGRLRAVVSTSSLDLGVDFLPVDRVLQVGSPKGIARLLQRAGRSGHAPGRVSRATCVPTHSFELVEAAAARRATEARRVEPRDSPRKPIDVLLQHIVTVALGGGFKRDDLFAEVRETWAYRDLTDDEWRWALDFVINGGNALRAYPEYRKVVADDAGVLRVPDRTIAKRHRMSVGTIVGDASVEVRFLRGGRIGTVEESFLSRLQPGESFVFAGRKLELVRVNEMVGYVRKSSSPNASIARWMGGRMPLSSELAAAVRELITSAAHDEYDEPELLALRPLFKLQKRWSIIPTQDELLVEAVQTREGHHLFVFPFAGRLVHTGLAALLAWRLARRRPLTFSLAANDYGFELLCPEPVDWHGLIDASLFSTEDLSADITHSMNAGEMARRRFREIARVSGLVFQGFPGAQKSMRQLQASSGLIYDVFARYDPDNLLLRQAREESLQQELEFSRLRETLDSMQQRALRFVRPTHVTPFAFPLLIERIREKLSTEKLADRVARMVKALERAADRPQKEAA
ncbi:MAG: ligase-associated DNA damage response DEXH box helicase [Betaproteobacteria bacterium]